MQRLAEQSAPTVEWLVDCVGARLSLMTAYKHIGPYASSGCTRRSRGVARISSTTCWRALPEARIPLAVGNGADQLIVAGNAVRRRRA